MDASHDNFAVLSEPGHHGNVVQVYAVFDTVGAAADYARRSKCWIVTGWRFTADDAYPRSVVEDLVGCGTWKRVR